METDGGGAPQAATARPAGSSSRVRPGWAFSTASTRRLFASARVRRLRRSFQVRPMAEAVAATASRPETAARTGGWASAPFSSDEIRPETSGRTRAAIPSRVRRSSPIRGWSSTMPAARGMTSRPGTAPVAPPVRPAAATDASSQLPIRTNLRPMESRTISITPPMPGRAVSSRAASTLSGSPPRLWAAKAVTLAATAQQACHRANSDDGTAVAERAAFVVEGVCRDCGGWTYKRSGRCCSSGA